MIPVTLRLKNFMSYGTDAPELDFELFQVACLSGRNGQGKSALLDALTWSLWGEGRKSSGSHKPDDELLRIGEREMQVEFVFDVEGERYRVVRSYARSASGKTSRSELELHVRDDQDEGGYRAITGASMRETQEKIDHVVGLDYNTFINSAFLLQGRSDEFTKKRPSERKEILARILNLGRYEALYALAADQERDARRAEEQASLDVDRLQGAVAPAAEWEQERKEVAAAIDQHREALAALRTREESLTRRLADLEARAREADALGGTIRRLDEQLARHQQDSTELKARIAEAEQCIARREEIQLSHARLLALQKERDELDQKNMLFRGVEKQIERTEAELRDLKNALERKLDRLDVEQKNDERRRDEQAALLAEAPTVERKLADARAAAQEVASLREQAQRKAELEAEVRAIEQTLHGQRESLGSKLKTLVEQHERERASLQGEEALRREHDALQAEAKCLSERQDRLAQVEERGKAVAAEIHRQSTLHSARSEALEALAAQRDQLTDDLGGRCPTCGTVLTAAHREEVRAQFNEDLEALRKETGYLSEQVERRKAERDAVAAEYLTVRGEVQQLHDAPGRLATVQEKLRRLDERRTLLAQQEREAEEIRSRLEEERYGEEERRRLHTLRSEHETLAFDKKHFELRQALAAQVTHLEQQKNRLEEIRGRTEQLDAGLARRRKDLEAVRRQLDAGPELTTLQETIEGYKKQLASVGFDARRFQEVKQQVEALQDAASEMNKLVNAQQNRSEWKERFAEIAERSDRLRKERDELTERRRALEAELEGRAVLVAEREELAAAGRDAEARLAESQRQLGQILEKLEQAARDRQLLKQRRQEHEDARRQRNLYKHLKTAFGRHGIPSLIIEQTLPEIEERSNELLERLTEGRMHVRLDTLKDKKTGGTRETLEIKITDEQGVSRPYETFSGGEAFRVNFALRIALAQLLAERNGVRIRTLVIDEGFGTQDQQGVQSLVEAIQSIQDDFAKILVITHLPDLKEAFPVRIEVEKDPARGSRFEVMGV